MENRNIFYCIVLSQQQEEFLDSAKSGVNRYRFIHFLARNAVMEQTACKVKGYTVSLQVGQVAFAEGELARLFGCERKTIQRLVESMRALQLVSTNSTNRATVFTLLYLSGWLIEGNMVRNPYYHRPLAKTRLENVVSVPSGMNVTSPNNPLLPFVQRKLTRWITEASPNVNPTVMPTSFSTGWIMLLANLGNSTRKPCWICRRLQLRH